MRIKSSMAVLACLLGVQQTSAQRTAQQDKLSPQIIAQAYDRCMATSGVRLTKTDASDEEIYARARQTCQPLNDQLHAAIEAQLPPEQATEILRSLTVQAKPKFMSMLARIRSDRARSAGGHSIVTGAQAGLDPANPAQCEVALGIVAIMADSFSPKAAPELRRRLALAKEQSAVRFKPEEATAVRKAVWPLLRDQNVLVKFSETCPK